MGGLLSFLLRGRTQAILVATALLLVPPASLLSGAVVALVTLRYGLLEGALVLGASSVAASAAAMLVGFTAGEIRSVASFAVTFGLPLVVLAAVLRATASQGLVLAAAGAVGALANVVMYLWVRDPESWWRELIDRLLVQPVRASQPMLSAQELERLEAWADVYAALMSVVAVAWYVMVVLLFLYLARWAQAKVDNPGGFGKEFRALRIDRRVSYVAVGVGLLALAVSGGGLPSALFAVAVALLLVQGVAIVHALVAARGLSGGWLVVTYLGVLFVGYAFVPALALAGLTDPWMDWRRRLGGAARDD